MTKLAEGTRLVVGSHEVTVVRFLLEGGFSQIYEVTMDPPEGGSEIGCLKQVIVPDKNGLNTLRKEVDVMKTLRKAQSIVRYYDSNAERLENGTYQVLVLMELCPNKSLLDYMNAHIREKLLEKDILKIMKDIAVGIYEMHKLKLVHRDIKIENVLIDAHHHFKLCDFGSVSPPIRPPKDQQEFQALSHDILYQTTPQYRAPEMIDLYRGFPIDERADIWALGCFLYKLCYYITPFEANGDIAILHALFQFPPMPVYSGDMKNLIIIMLQESPLYRPNIVQILMLLCRMIGVEFSELGVEDFYHAGEYNFQALHEMQRQKQEALLKQQQQYYLEQQKQQEYESRRKEQLSAHPLLQDIGLTLKHGHGSVGDMQRASSRTPQPWVDPSLSKQLQSNSGPPAESKVAVQEQAPRIVSTHKSPAQAPHSLPVSQGLPELDNASTQPKDFDFALSDHSASQPKTPILSPKFNSAKTGNSIKSFDSSDESEVDMAALPNLEDAENRYPSLEALEIVLPAATSAKSQEKLTVGSAESSHTAKSNMLRANSGKQKFVDETNFDLRSSSQKKQSHLENIEAWQKLTTSINRNAERLVDEIFVLRTTTNDALANVRKSNSFKSARSQESIDATAHGESSEPMTSKLDETSMPPPKPKEPEQKEAPEFPAFSNTSAQKSQPVSASQNPTLLSLAQNNVEHKRESSNPWGDVLRKKDQQTLDVPSQSNTLNKSPVFGLEDQVLKLNLESSTQPSTFTTPQYEANLIELETGLSSSNSELGPPLPLRPSGKYEEVSLLDLNFDEEFNKRKEIKPVFKKRGSGAPSQPIALQEEVIDFASDDENYKSEMSRMSIRNSLKKPKSRKTSEHNPTQRRSDSSHADHRKRLSFLGGSQEKKDG